MENGGSRNGAGPADGASRIIEVPLQSSGELLEINLDELTHDSVQEIIDLFNTEATAVSYWIKIAQEYQRRGRLDVASQLLEAGVAAFVNAHEPSTIPLLCMLASIQMHLARSAPSKILPSPQIYTAKGDPKATFFSKATAYVTQAEAVDSRNGFVLDTKATLYLLMGKYDEAYRTYEHILKDHPGHLLALMGKARILYIRRQFRAALKLYQSVLSAAPDFLPDPRIGIGLSFWNLGDYRLARKAWERSRVVNAGKPSNGASLLLGLSWLNVAREARLPEEDRVEAYSRGIGFVQEAWSNDKTCAATAAALAGYFLTSNSQWDTVIKLAELATQHGEGRAIISEGQLAIARALHAQDKTDEAMKHYSLAMEANPDQTVAALGVAQVHTRRQDYPAAINAYEKLLRKQPRCIEAMVSLASLHARAALQAGTPTTTAATPDASSDKSKARELFDQVATLFQAPEQDGKGRAKDPLAERFYLDPTGSRVQQVATDPDLYVEIARLWTGEESSKSLSAYRQSLQVRLDKLGADEGDDAEANGESIDLANNEDDGVVRYPRNFPPQLLCNIGALEFTRKEYVSAYNRFEHAMKLDAQRQQDAAAKGTSTAEGDAVLMTVTYNLGIVMEERGMINEAIELYEQRLLTRHPEFLEAKARLALLALRNRQHERCVDFLKAALTAQPGHLDIRALYTYFLMEIGNPSAAKDFAVMTLKDYSKVDTYAMNAMAHLLYNQARENRDTKPEAIKDRTSRYFRACEAFDRVLQLDPNCAYAAQGLAIALAEGNLGGKTLNGAAGTEAAQRSRNLRDALGILTRIRETSGNAPIDGRNSGGNVYVNIGLCHFLRDEYERAIEAFETAVNRFFKRGNAQALVYLARARFHKANKDQNFTTLQAALQAAQAALALNPKDDSIRFNISLIQQKGLELLQGLPSAKRRISEIQTALADAEIAQETFAVLASNKATGLTYSIDLADQRRRYGEGLVKRAPATLQEQEEWEESEQNKVEIAKRDREAERARLAEIERKRTEDAKREAEELAAQRKQMIEDSRAWYVKPVEMSEDEDGEKKGKRKGKKKKGDADDGIVPDGEGEEEVVKPKKRKKAAAGEGGAKKTKKGKKEDAGAAKAADASDAGDGSAASDTGPARPSKRAKGKQYRTKEFISDSE